jgi:hypothetical protein
MQQSVKSCSEAITLFELAPSKAALDDRSFMFNGYSLFSLLTNNGQVAPSTTQSLAEVKSGTSSNFVQETQSHLFHYCRALSMKVESLASSEKFDEAFALLDKMKLIYDPALHSKAIADAYGTDHCASMISASAMWYHRLNHTEEALVICDDVIERILPEVVKTNVNNSNLLGLNYVMVGIIEPLRAQDHMGARRARDLYNLHVVAPYNPNRASRGSWYIR